MKLKYLMLGLAATALMSTSASAQTVLRIVGSTAFRAPATAAIVAYIQANGVGGNCFGTAVNTGSLNSNSSDLYGASAGLFEDSTTSPTIVVKTYWTGSLAGVIDVVADTTGQDTFLVQNSTNTPTLVVLNGTNSATSTNYGFIQTVKTAETDTSAPNAAFSDSYYTSVAEAVATAGKFSAPVDGTTNSGVLEQDIINSGIAAAGTGNDSANDQVGIVPFAWWTGRSTTSPGITNITQAAINGLIGGGSYPVGFLTGNSTQKNDYVYLIGRNEDSGTRIAAESNAQNTYPNGGGAGFGNATLQWELTFSNNQQTGTGLSTGGTGATVTGLRAFDENALNTEPNINWKSFGHTGYVAGGDVKNVLLATDPDTGLTFTVQGGHGKPSENSGKIYFIGYLGWADGNGVDSLSTNTGPGQYLSYNGVAPTVANILNGQYSFWTYEHLYYLPSSTGAPNAVVSGGNQAIADGIADQIYTSYAWTNTNGETASSDANEESLSPPPAGILIDAADLAGLSGTEGTYPAPTY
jgi:hypothetical protein